MGENSREGSGAFTNGGLILALLLTASAAWLHKDAALQGVRPELPEASFHSIPPQAAEARLWQDPFAAVADKIKPETPEAAPLKPSPRPPCAKEGTDAGPAVLNLADPRLCQPSTSILAVLVEGDPYSADAEFRRRLRYAVVAALGRKGFQPEDSTHIHYFQRPDRAGSGNPTIVPYEWFERPPRAARGTKNAAGDSSNESVLVAWIDENALVDKTNDDGPLLRLAEIIGDPNDLTPKPLAEGDEKPPGERDRQKARLAIVGPETTDVLKLLIGDFSNHTDHWLSGIPFYAYGPTEIITENALTNQKPLPNNIKLTITPDHIVAKAIRQELGRRNVHFDTDSIALISEWDTSYGRDIKATMTSTFQASSGGPGSTGHDNRPYFYGYLRGIDGEIASDKKSKPAAKNSESSDNDKDPLESQAKARYFDSLEGLGQYDYLRRLEDELKAKDDLLKLDGGPGLRAIGVLGSDVYDKLLVLRALKPSFPNAIFFTTDYDVSLQTASERKFTRNLIVGSAYGGTLGDGQGEIPPFRSTYQTSAFAATLAALCDDHVLDAYSNRATLFEMTRDGQLREIGRYPSRAAQMETVSNEGCVSKRPLAKDQRTLLFSPVSSAVKTNVGVLSAAGALLLMFYIFASFQSARKERLFNEDQQQDADSGDAPPRKTVARPPILFFSAGRVFALFCTVWLLFIGFGVWFWEPIAGKLTESGEGAVISATEGLSVWPTIAIRILNMALAILFVAIAQLRLNANNREIVAHGDFGLVDPRPAPVLDRNQRMASGVLKTLCVRSVNALKYWISLVSPKAPTFIEKQTEQNGWYPLGPAWTNYVHAGNTYERVIRSLLVTLILCGVFWFFMSEFDDGTPAIRGALARAWFRRSIYGEFFFVTFLTIYIADATALCLAFIDDLQHNKTFWPNREPPPDAAGSDDACRIANDSRDLRFIEMRTRCILPMVYFPFLLIALSIVARSDIFAPYPLSPAVVIGVVCGLGIVFLCAWAMSRDAERTRAQAIGNLKEAILGLKRDDAASDLKAAHLEALMEEANGARQGAFSPIWSQPLVKGLIIPAAGLASKFLFERDWSSGF
ncbi:hypothetical protein [uncultured Rhodoblastus sp.]|uniref:hypothetical protein n=1 Tax=uncultured Rhodoblastus sp. TaxID=543037 RepID=UPI0025FBFFE0|nr:hypothetical protein [uncultured Rhodoblastus sp.]